MEFAISSIVLLLLMMGLLDLSRAFYFAVNLDGAAREGARHGAWFNTASRKNIYLYDQTIWDTVNQSL
ncbi:MAG TPA: TadE/TadG family type IV pilus assembly protein, partial [Candidatus Polarisedimenticolia bacterium]|nr:TadE/TadG family type IV pilus assembly protein [Candidatus Polarisedimenticolia bacterium]